MRKLIILIGAIIFGSHLSAQVNEAAARYDSIYKAYLLTGDSMPHLELDEIAIIPPPQFDRKRDARRYWRLVRNLKVVLPYARVVNKTIAEMEVKLAQTPEDRDRRRYIKSVEDSLWNQYEPELRKMTISQGRLLFKLVDRESSNTTYHWIEYYKGSLTAFFWQGIARIFGSNLKSGFDPDDPGDAMIEQLVRYIDLGYI